jgi:hypothetical protein
MIFSAKMENYTNVFCQSDGGQKGLEVRLFTLLDKSYKRISKHGSVCQFWAGLTYTGKTSTAAAEGTNHSFRKFGRPSKKMSGCCGDSGAGTPQSYANSLNAKISLSACPEPSNVAARVSAEHIVKPLIWAYLPKL